MLWASASNILDIPTLWVSDRNLEWPQNFLITESNFLWIETGSHLNHLLIPPCGLVTRCNETKWQKIWLNWNAMICEQERRKRRKQRLTYKEMRLERPRARTNPMLWFSAPAKPFPITTTRRIAPSNISDILRFFHSFQIWNKNEMSGKENRNSFQNPVWSGPTRFTPT